MRTRPRKKAELLKLGYISSTLVLLLIDIGRALKLNPESKLQCVVPRPDLATRFEGSATSLKKRAVRCVSVEASSR